VQANTSCFMTACIAGLFYSARIAEDMEEQSGLADLIGFVLGLIPGYKELMSLAGF